jgi:hypothetical protein
VKSFSILAIIIAGNLTFTAAFADDKSWSAWKAAHERRRYIHTTRPRRLDEPLRVENISDDEVREIQAVILEVFPGAIANISGVTDKCPCEEGPACDSQVWVLAHRNDRYDGVLLSRVESKWMVGSIQLWWFRYDQLQRQMVSSLLAKTPDDRERYQRVLEEMTLHQDLFPSCPSLTPDTIQ